MAGMRILAILVYKVGETYENINSSFNEYKLYAFKSFLRSSVILS